MALVLFLGALLTWRASAQLLEYGTLRVTER